MAYDPEKLVLLRHLLSFGERFLVITDEHDDRITSLENASTSKIWYNTKAHWDETPSLIPEAGTVIIYSDYASADGRDFPNFKIADGKAYLSDLPFCGDDLRAVVAQHLADSAIHLSTDDRTKLEGSVTATAERIDAENYRLVLS